MKSKFILLLAIIIFAGLTYLLSIVIEKTKNTPVQKTKKKKVSETLENDSGKKKGNASGIMESMQFISQMRAYPESDIPHDKFFRAFEYSSENLQQVNNSDINHQWSSLGPNNIGGRSLGIAVHPVDTNIVFLGSASGGLWKSTTGGTGANAWTLVNTGFPSSAVSSIAIDSADPDKMYIGTGENYGYMFSQYGLDVRVTRGMYGIGILKSIDGGNTWSKSLDWSYNNERGVWKVIINNKNPDILYTATSEGIYKSNNAGNNWSQMLSYRMVMDLELNQSDTNVLYASIGNLTNNVPQNEKGIYKSTNSGVNWIKLSGGLPASWTGKTTLELYEGNQDFVYASISNDFSYIGYYRSSNAGQNWTQLSTSVPIGSQGWYNNGHIVKQDDPNTVLVGTINVEKSVNGGSSFQTKSDWSAWVEGATPPGDPEGPDNFVHADVHYYAVNPKDKNKLYIAADGGLYRSNDFGETFYSCNGGFVTSQFYASFANSYQDSIFCLGGMQDNRSAFYQGNNAWYKTFFGDGMSCAINSQNDQICYTEYVYGSMYKSTDRGINWFGISPPGGGNSANYCFVTPFISCVSNPQIMYVGGKSIYKSTTGGGNWLGPYGTAEFNNSKILSLAGSHIGADTLYCGLVNGTVFRSFNGGVNWTNITGSVIPNRYVTDITVSPDNPAEVYLTLGGFNSAHIFKTTNSGTDWQDISGNLPDIPHHSVVVDPDYNQNIYVGNDLGVYVTTNAGLNWNEYSSGMPYTLVFDLTIVYPNRKIRATTHGNGIYERKLMETPVGITSENNILVSGFSLSQNYPNPFNPNTIIEFNVKTASEIQLKVFDITGKNISIPVNERKYPGSYEVNFDGSNYSSGIYFYSLYSDGKLVETKRMMLLK
ncbi:MAG TPA: T9SS type A sorting domain-containing protein [Ignavibacteria bacterium]|nr:T9SS type A sorting domain-containing protein [Ignavibacteria bacterium]